MCAENRVLGRMSNNVISEYYILQNMTHRTYHVRSTLNLNFGTILRSYNMKNNSEICIFIYNNCRARLAKPNTFSCQEKRVGRFDLNPIQFSGPKV